MRLENVSLKKNENPILKGIDFGDSQCRNWIILGDSGSGKSTFLDVLGSKIFPTGGRFIKDKNLSVVSVSRDYSFHKIVGAAYQYYQQRYNAHDSETGPTVYEVLQNQVLPIGTVDSTSVQLPPLAYSNEKVTETATLFKINHLLQRKVTTLSNGETRRTLLAYWFLKSPDVMLLDSPFVGLDLNSRVELKEILSTIKNVQIFLVCDLKDVPSGFEWFLELADGKINYQGHKEDYIENVAAVSELPVSILSEDKGPDFITAIKMVDVNVSYGEKEVLTNINWEVKRGEKWAVLGANGSGKSTLMSLITADNPQAYRNEIYLFDKKRGTGESIWDLKKRIGFVSPELHLFFHKNTPVWKVVASGFFDTMGLFRTLSENQTAEVNRFLEVFKMDNLRDKPLNHLSSGQQRMVFLMRALVKNPQVLILDEPCQGLDYNQMVFFRETLNVIAQKKTMIYITHYMEEIPACVNKKLFLDEGLIVGN